MNLEYYKIPNDFKIGASSAAWQAEGRKGKTDSQVNWADAFYQSVPERWHNGYGTTIGTDFYSRYEEDIQIMKNLNLQSFRTSIDWSRFLIDYENIVVSEDAVNFYNNVINSLIENGIQPIICLEHWEIPDILLKKYGGWESKKVVELYVKYAEKAFEAFADRVKIWYTFNEPGVVTSLGLTEGLWYPFEADYKKAVQWNYNKVLATAKTVKLFKEKDYDKAGGKIGIIINTQPTYSRSNTKEDKEAAHMAQLLDDKVYFDPCILGEYPKEVFEILSKHNCLFSHTEEELNIIKNNTIQILGLNYYNPKRVKVRNSIWDDSKSFNPLYYYENWSMPGAKINPSRGWEIYAKGIYDLAVLIRDEYKNIEFMVMENGMGVEGEQAYKNDEGEIQDDYRIDFVADHLRWLFKAMEEGANCIAYHMWNFTDNVSPMNAFKNRYGFVEIDLSDNRNRRVKKSGKWIKDVIEDGGFCYQSFQPNFK